MRKSWGENRPNQRIFALLYTCTAKKVEQKQLPWGAVLKNGAPLAGGAVFFLNNHV